MRHITVIATVLFAAYATGSRAAAHAGAQHEAVKAPMKNTKAWRAMEKDYREAVLPVFEAKCFDCHSAKTRYPWYYRMPLAKGLVDTDIRKARKIIDFTDGFPFQGLGTLGDMLGGLREVALDGSMPPFRYWIMHWSSRLTKAEKELVAAWTEGKPLPARPAPTAAK